MERVAALVEKLTTQLAEKADKSQLKQTAVQLLAALSDTDHVNNLPNNVSVMIPGGDEVAEVIDNTTSRGRTIRFLWEDLAEVIESPIPEIQPVEVRIPSLPKLEPVKASVVPLVPVEPASIPMEINATISNTELQEKLALDPIKDLKAGIGTNDKFQFIASLFGGDEKAFDQAIKTINGFKIYAEAQFWIKSNLREQNKWEETDDVVKAFDLLVKRRFA